MVQIENNKGSFVMLWRLLEHTRQLLAAQYRRFCIRRIMQYWFPFGLQRPCMRASPQGGLERSMCQVCDLCQQGGYEVLPKPCLYPRPHREFLRALVAVRLGIGMRHVDLHALDAAYSVVFPNSTPINVNKKKRCR